MVQFFEDAIEGLENQMISNEIMEVVVLVTGVGCALVSGIFFIFSNTVMKALKEIDDAHAIVTMQSINAVILNPLFFLVFFGTALASLFLLVASLLEFHEYRIPYVLSGSVSYLVCIVVTALFNVPMNNSLDAVSSDNPDAMAVWDDYRRRWTFWNTVRTVSTILAIVLFMLALKS